MVCKGDKDCITSEKRFLGWWGLREKRRKQEKRRLYWSMGVSQLQRKARNFGWKWNAAQISKLPSGIFGVPSEALLFSRSERNVVKFGTNSPVSGFKQRRAVLKNLTIIQQCDCPNRFFLQKVNMQMDSRSIRIHFRRSIYAKECSNRPPDLNLLRFNFKGIISVLEIAFVSHCYEAIWVIHQRTCNVFIQLKKENKNNARLSTRKKTKQTPGMLSAFWSSIENTSQFLN